MTCSLFVIAKESPLTIVADFLSRINLCKSLNRCQL